MVRIIGRRSTAIAAGSLVVAAPILSACSSGPSAEAWAATDGAAGRINLDDVQDAFKDSESATEFEKKVNEIYEGDNIVLIRANQNGDSLELEGWEDLNGNQTIDDSSDDRLFGILQENDRNEMRGYGHNGYYHNSFGGGGFLFGYLLASSFGRSGGVIYQTSPARARTIRSDRSTYRSSSRYQSQVSKNTNYFNRQKSFAGSNYQNTRASSARSSYIGRQTSSGAFRTSSTGVRTRFGGSGSSVRSSSGSRSSSGFRGFGGAQRVIGVSRI